MKFIAGIIFLNGIWQPTIHPVQTTVTVGKSDLKQRGFVKLQVQGLCKNIREENHETVFVPKEGKLIEFLGVLRYHKIPYGTLISTPA